MSIPLGQVRRIFPTDIPLVLEHRVHGNEIEREQNGGGNADMAEGNVGSMVAQQNGECHQPQQDDFKSGRQNVTLTQPGINRGFTVQKVQQHDQQQIEDAASHYITQGDVGGVFDAHGTDPGHQFGERSDCCQHGETYPAAAQARLFSHHIAAKGQIKPRQTQRQGQQGKFSKDLNHDVVVIESLKTSTRPTQRGQGNGIFLKARTHEPVA